MGRRVFALFFFLLLAGSFSVTVLADNSVGRVQTDLEFLGISYGNDGLTPTIGAIDGVISKSIGSGSPLSLGTQSIFYYWDIPYDLGTANLDFSVMLSAQAFSCRCYIYGYTQNSWANGSITLLGEIWLGNGINDTDSSIFIARGDYSYDFSGFDMICVELRPIDPVYLYNTISYFESSQSASNISLFPDSSTSSISLSGRVGFGSLPPNYVSASNSNYNTFVTSLLSIAPVSSGSSVSGAKFTSSIILSNVFGSASGLTATSNRVIHTADSGTVTTTSYTGTLGAIPGQSISASSAHDVMAYGYMSATYGDDDGLVDTVKHMDGTLDGIADNMQTIIDDMHATKDTASEIGGTTSAEQVSGTQETLSSGTSSLGTLTDTATGQLQGVMQGASGYLSLVNMAVPIMFEFGVPSGVRPLLIALLVMVSVSVLAFVFRRLL